MYMFVLSLVIAASVRWATLYPGMPNEQAPSSGEKQLRDDVGRITQ